MHGPETRFLAMAARLALRGHGGAEPNPQVGCVIVSPRGEVAGWGYHRRCGGPHAEVEALRRAGPRAAGSTVHVTLEPCNHTGRTGPCAEALVAARVARVVYARRDPTPVAGGGAERLRAAGIRAEECPCCAAAVAVAEPYVHRVVTGLPWVVCKWAQTLDGRVAASSGASRWISGERSRRMVHRERGRVDAILTGIGTVLADDPRLTPRGVRVRRIARRVVVDPDLEIPPRAKLVTTAREVPTLVACRDAALDTRAEVAGELRRSGVEILALPSSGRELPLRDLLLALVDRYQAAHVLVESGPRLLGRLFRDRLVDEVWAFVAPMLLGDDRALPAVRGLNAPALAEAVPLRLAEARRRGPDVFLRYLR